MKVLSAGTIKLSVLLAFTWLLLCSAGSSLNQSSLRGRLLNQTTKEPIEGAKIILLSGNEENIVYTDEEGKFKFLNLEGGKYSIIISKIGYTEEKIRDVEVLSSEPNFLVINVKEVENIFSVHRGN